MQTVNIGQLIETSDNYLMKTYNRFPIAFVDAHDASLIDSEGKEYTDFLAGIAVNNLGYSNEKVKKAMIDQINSIIHTSNYFQIPTQTELAKVLCDNSFGDKAFFCNSGAEANEAAIKIARKYAYEKHGKQKHEIISASGSFHGRTLMTLNLTDNENYREGYGPHPAGFQFSTFNDCEDLKSSVNANTAAIVIEPIQGEGGVHPATTEFLQTAKELATSFDCALIFDEVQCGMGRSGQLFAYEHYQVEPDLMTLAKGLGNGVPIGAVIANKKYSDVLQAGSHGTTFGGNPLVTAAALAAVKEINQTNVLDDVQAKGRYFIKKLETLKAESIYIKEIRGRGLMIGMELTFNGDVIVKTMLDKGFVINCTQGNVLRFLPPFVITTAQIDDMLTNLTAVLAAEGASK